MRPEPQLRPPAEGRPPSSPAPDPRHLSAGGSLPSPAAPLASTFLVRPTAVTARRARFASHPARRRLARAAAATLLAGSLLLSGAAPSAAHVRVLADDPTAGSFSVLTFRVPNESDTAGTVKLAVTLPADTPFLDVSTKPLPGWTATTAEARLPAPVEVEGTTVTKAVRTVTWTAGRGVELGPGQFQEFAISVGPLPDPTTILLPAVQTYSDGTVVTWNQASPASGQEPEHPAPEFTITPAIADDPADDRPLPVDPPGSTGGAWSGYGDPVARLLAGVGLGLGAVALVLGVIGLRRRGAP